MLVRIGNEISVLPALERERGGKAEEAIEELLRASDALLTSSRPMAAVHADAVLSYAASLAARAREVRRQTKLKISESRSRLAASDLVERLTGVDEQRATCTDCDTEKPAAWLRCPKCGALPTFEHEVAASLLRSRRLAAADAGSGAVLDDASLRALERELAAALSRVLASVLHEAPAPASEPSWPERDVFGTLMACVSDDARAGVLVDFDLPGRPVPLSDDSVHRFLRAWSAELVHAEGAAELALQRRKREFHATFGGSVEIVSLERVHVENAGRVVVESMGVMASDPKRPGRDCLGSVGAAALVGVEIDGAPDETADDLAKHLASHLISRAWSDVGTRRSGDLGALQRERFRLDPSITVGDAVRIVSQFVGREVRIAGWAYRQRLPPRDDGPGRFPMEAARRA